MPTYDFRCPKCSHQFEAALSFGSKVRPLCPQCGYAKAEKLITPPTIHFKGSGFFKTDSRKTAGKKPEEPPPTKPSDKPAKKPADTKSEKGGDATTGKSA